MVNQSVNEFHTRFLFKIDVLPQDVVLPLDIAATFFNTLIPEVREFLIQEGVNYPPRKPTETNPKGNQRLPLVINAAAEAEKKTRTIKIRIETSERNASS